MSTSIGRATGSTSLLTHVQHLVVFVMALSALVVATLRPHEQVIRLMAPAVATPPTIARDAKTTAHSLHTSRRLHDFSTVVAAQPQIVLDTTVSSPPPRAASSPPPPPALSQRALAISRFVKPHDGTCTGPCTRCHYHGVYQPALHECRCTAGWGGRFCEERQRRPCNWNTGGGQTNADSLCAGNCDDDRGLCYCAGLNTPFQRPLPHYCAPWAHRNTKLPDGRPAYPVQARDGTWQMARLIYERPNKERPWLGEWARYYLSTRLSRPPASARTCLFHCALPWRVGL